MVTPARLPEAPSAHDTVTADQIQEYLDQLCSEEEYDEIEGFWYFLSGGSCCTCTDSAVKIAQNFGGVVFGYSSEDNPTAFLGEPHCSGHDFAIIAEDYIVDYWAFYIRQLSTKPILNLKEPEDRSYADYLYGDSALWSELYDFSNTKVVI